MLSLGLFCGDPNCEESAFSKCPYSRGDRSSVPTSIRI